MFDTGSFFEPALMMAHATVGVDRLLWGTGDPFITTDSAYVERLPLPKADTAKILGANAARLLGLKG